MFKPIRNSLRDDVQRFSRTAPRASISREALPEGNRGLLAADSSTLMFDSLRWLPDVLSFPVNVAIFPRCCCRRLLLRALRLVDRDRVSQRNLVQFAEVAPATVRGLEDGRKIGAARSQKGDW